MRPFRSGREEPHQHRSQHSADGTVDPRPGRQDELPVAMASATSRTETRAHSALSPPQSASVWTAMPAIRSSGTRRSAQMARPSRRVRTSARMSARIGENSITVTKRSGRGAARALAGRLPPAPGNVRAAVLGARRVRGRPVHRRRVRRVLELGAGHGRDAPYLARRGLIMTVSDRDGLRRRRGGPLGRGRADDRDRRPDQHPGARCTRPTAVARWRSDRGVRVHAAVHGPDHGADRGTGRRGVPGSL
jgi:hypothetical protein